MTEIRTLAPEHADALARFFEVLKADGANKFFLPHPLTAEAAREKANYDGKDLFVLLFKKNDVLGYGMLRGWDEGYDIPSLGIAIHPEEQSRGLGRLMMKFLATAASERGAKKIRLRVHRENKPAISLYRALGYHLVSDDDGQYLVGYLKLAP